MMTVGKLSEIHWSKQGDFLSQAYGGSYSTQRQECCVTSEGPGVGSWKYCLGNILSENIHLSVFFIDCSLEELAEICCPLLWRAHATVQYSKIEPVSWSQFRSSDQPLLDKGRGRGHVIQDYCWGCPTVGEGMNLWGSVPQTAIGPCLS